MEDTRETNHNKLAALRQLKEHMTTETKTDIVAQARESLRLRWKQELRDERIKLNADAEAAWIQAEAQRKSDFIHQFKYRRTLDEKPENPYLALHDGEALRVATPAENRIDVLAEAGFFEEIAKIIVHRAGGQISLVALQEALAKWIPVVGDAEITQIDSHPAYPTNLVGLVHRGRTFERTLATGVSPELRDAISDAQLEVRKGMVVWRDWREYPSHEY
jgi:hypothetical protein